MAFPNELSEITPNTTSSISRDGRNFSPGNFQLVCSCLLRNSLMWDEGKPRVRVARAVAPAIPTLSYHRVARITSWMLRTPGSHMCRWECLFRERVRFPRDFIPSIHASLLVWAPLAWVVSYMGACSPGR